LVPRLSSLPIIVLTATASAEIEAELRTYGASHYLTKPIDFMRLNLALAQANIASVMSRLAGRHDSTEMPVISS
jgi:CheY-like chemotaxis protein